CLDRSCLIAEHFLECGVRAPESRRLGSRWRRQAPAESFKHLSDETFRGPIRETNPSARLADARKFGSRLCLVWREHDTEGGDDHIEGRVIEWKTLGVRLEESDRESLRHCARASAFK